MISLQRLRYLARHLAEPARRNAEYFARRRQAFALVAVIGFPAYYLVWTELFPQVYENLGLRLLGSLIFIPVLWQSRCPPRWKNLGAVYWYAALIYALPFFFAFMLFKNAGAAVWIESALIALFVMVLLLDWVSMILHLMIGVGLAWLAYWLSTPEPALGVAILSHLPVLFFAVVLGMISNYATEVVRVEQEKAMLATAGSIAHELRTPLLGIKSGAVGLRNYLPALIEAYSQAKAAGLAVQPLRLAHLDAMGGVLERIVREVEYASAIMEMLIANVRESGESEVQRVCSLSACIETAMKRYPFAERERRLVSLDLRGDIRFLGAELMMVHVLFNLIKNALRSIHAAGQGEIRITLVGDRLVFRDTGPGIPPEVLPHVFRRFYSAAGSVSMPGSGIGLAFCRDVMTALGGHISCQSRPGEFTEFVLSFPECAS